MNGLLRDPKPLRVFLFGAVFEVKLVDQLICDFLNLVRFKKSGDQGYSAIYGSHAERGRI